MKYKSIMGWTMLAIAAQSAGATTYWVSRGAANGGDGSSSKPWNAISQVNAFTGYQPGAIVQFRAGDIFEGRINAKGGVTYTSYGAGRATISAAKTVPYYKPFSVLTRWSNSGSYSTYNVWSANIQDLIVADSDAQGVQWAENVEQLFFNGIKFSRARFPSVLNGGTSGASRFLPGMAASNANGLTAVVANYGNLGVTTTHYLDLSALGTAVGKPLSISDLDGASVFRKDAEYGLSAFVATANATSKQLQLAVDASWEPPKVAATAGASSGGYWLENKPWMIKDSYQFAYDAKTHTLYLALPKSAQISSNSIIQFSAYVNAIQAIGPGLSSVNINNLAITGSRGAAIDVDVHRNSNPATFQIGSLQITNNYITNSGRQAIHILHTNGPTMLPLGTPSTAAYISNNVIDGTNVTAIDLLLDSSNAIDIRNNAVTNVGTNYYADAGIRSGNFALIDGNTVQTVSYLGIHAGKFDTVTHNLVTDSCMRFNDCGGIYTRGLDSDASQAGYSSSVTPIDTVTNISQNLVYQTDLNRSGRYFDVLDGTPPGSTTYVVGKGVYLDDFASNTTVSANSVYRYETGIHIHNGRSNTVSYNALFGSSLNHIWLQEGVPTLNECNSAPNPAHDIFIKLGCGITLTETVYGNMVNNNAMASTWPQSAASSRDQKAIVLTANAPALASLPSTPAQDPTSDFALFQNNVYATQLGDADYFAKEYTNFPVVTGGLASWKSGSAYIAQGTTTSVPQDAGTSEKTGVALDSNSFLMNSQPTASTLNACPFPYGDARCGASVIFNIVKYPGVPFSSTSNVVLPYTIPAYSSAILLAY